MSMSPNLVSWAWAAWNLWARSRSYLSCRQPLARVQLVEQAEFPEMAEEVSRCFRSRRDSRSEAQVMAHIPHWK